MTTSEAEGNLDAGAGCVQIAASGNYRAALLDNECSIELSQFLYGASQIRVGDIPQLSRMQGYGIQNQRPGTLQDSASATQGTLPACHVSQATPSAATPIAIHCVRRRRSFSSIEPNMMLTSGLMK